MNVAAEIGTVFQTLQDNINRLSDIVHIYEKRLEEESINIQNALIDIDERLAVLEENGE